MWLADDRNMLLICMKIVLPDDTSLSPWTTRPRCPGGQKAVVGIVNLPLQEGDRERSREAGSKGSDAQTGNRGARSDYGIRGLCAQPIIHLPIWGMRRTWTQRTDTAKKDMIAGKRSPMEWSIYRKCRLPLCRKRFLPTMTMTPEEANDTDTCHNWLSISEAISSCRSVLYH